MPNRRVSTSSRSSWSSAVPNSPPSAADDDRVDVEPVLVDEVQPAEGLDQVDPAERHVPARLLLQRTDLVGVHLGPQRGVGTDLRSVRENTISGTARQVPANSCMTGG